MSQLWPSLKYFMLPGRVQTSKIYGAVVCGKLGYIEGKLISSQEINLCFSMEQLAA